MRNTTHPPRCMNMQHVELDLTSLHAYRHPCDQLLDGIVAGNVKSIIKALEVQDRLNRIVDDLAAGFGVDGVNEDDLYRDVFEAAGAESMALALSIATGESLPIPARDIELPDVELAQ